MTDTREAAPSVNRRSLDQVALQVVCLAIFAGLLATLIFGLQAKSYQSFASVAAFGAASAGAALLVGGLVGFLFGIPRRLQQEHTNATTAAARPGDEDDSGRSLYSANTNLEQISDWLTKILVGVGLTQIGQIGTLLSDIGNVAASGLEGFAAAKPFFVATIVHFTVCGFLLGYLWTRLYLGRALTEAEQASTLKKKVDKYEQDVRALRLAAQQLAGESGVMPVSADDLVQAIKAASPETRAAIFYRAQYQRWRNWRDKKRIMRRTIPVFQALIASDADQEYHANYGELGYALKDQQPPDWKMAEEYLSDAIRIRGDARQQGFQAYEANRAICRIMLDPAFGQNPPAPSSGDIRQAILDDLAVANEEPWIRQWLDRDDVVLNWLTANKMGKKAHVRAES